MCECVKSLTWFRSLTVNCRLLFVSPRRQMDICNVGREFGAVIVPLGVGHVDNEPEWSLANETLSNDKTRRRVVHYIICSTRVNHHLRCKVTGRRDLVVKGAIERHLERYET